MSVSVAVALKRAVEATRKDREIEDYFPLREWRVLRFIWNNFDIKKEVFNQENWIEKYFLIFTFNLVARFL